MKTGILTIVMLFTLIGLRPACGEIITYVSGTLTPGPPLPGLGTGVLEATFSFTSPLTDGATLTEADINSWSMSALGRSMDSSNATFFDAEFNIGASLLPTTWGFAAELNLEADAEPETIYSANNGSGVGFMQVWDLFLLDDLLANQANFSGLGSEASDLMGAPGTFTKVPEPTSLALFGTIGLIACGRRRKS